MTHGSWAAPLTLELDRDLVNQFRPEAARRATTVPRLIREIIETLAAEPTLVTAVLDDAQEDRS